MSITSVGARGEITQRAPRYLNPALCPMRRHHLLVCPLGGAVGLTFEKVGRVYFCAGKQGACIDMNCLRVFLPGCDGKRRLKGCNIIDLGNRHELKQLKNSTESFQR